MGAVSTKIRVDLLKLTNEIENLFPIHGPSGGLAEVGAATEGAGFINEAFLGLRLQEGAGAVGGLGQMFSACSPKGLGGEEGFSTGELGYFSGKLKLAALGSPQAGALDGPA